MLTDIKTNVTCMMMAIIIIAQPLDVWTTNRALSSGKGIVELNSLMALAMERLGSYYWFPKFAIAAILSILLYRVIKRGIKSWTVVVACGLVANFYTFVVLNNYFMWF